MPPARSAPATSSGARTASWSATTPTSPGLLAARSSRSSRPPGRGWSSAPAAARAPRRVAAARCGARRRGLVALARSGRRRSRAGSTSAASRPRGAEECRRRDQRHAARPPRRRPAAARAGRRAGGGRGPRPGLSHRRDALGARHARGRAAGRPTAEACWWRRARRALRALVPRRRARRSRSCAPRSMPRFAERLARRLAELERWLLPADCLLCDAPVPEREDDRAGLRPLPLPVAPRAGAALRPLRPAAFGDLACRICAGWPDATRPGAERRLARRIGAPRGAPAQVRRLVARRRVAWREPMLAPGAIDRPGILDADPAGGARQRERGYNQSERLAAALGRLLGRAGAVRAAARGRGRPAPRRRLTPEERQANVAGAFRLRRRPRRGGGAGGRRVHHRRHAGRGGGGAGGGRSGPGRGGHLRPGRWSR